MKRFLFLLLIFSHSAYADYDFNNLKDESGYHQHMMLGGVTPPTVVSNPWSIGQDALQFSAETNVETDESMAVIDGGRFNLQSDYTIEFRFKRTVSRNGYQQVVLGRWGADSTSQRYLCYFTAGNILSYLENPSGPTLTSSAITDSSAHAVMISKSSGNLSMYIDGTRVAGPTASTASSATVNEPFVISSYDGNGGDGGVHYGFQFNGVLGEIRISNTARQTGASYVVSGSPLASDSNTLALWKMAAIYGTYLGTAAYQNIVLARSGHSQAAGGWAAPDGILQTNDNNWFFTLSAFDNTKWTAWAVIADTRASLLAGTGTLQSVAYQTPNSGIEGNLSSDGSVMYYNSTYYHWYQDATGNFRYSTGSSLGSAFSSPGTGTTGIASGGDQNVRFSYGSSSILEMFYANTNVVLEIQYGTSTNGTSWTPKPALNFTCAEPNYPADCGAPDMIQWNARAYTGFVDCSLTNATGRRVCRVATKDGVHWFHLGKFIDAPGVYVSVADTTASYDSTNSRIDLLAFVGDNAEPREPTDSDIAYYQIPVNQHAHIEQNIISGATIKGAVTN